MTKEKPRVVPLFFQDKEQFLTLPQKCHSVCSVPMPREELITNGDNSRGQDLSDPAATYISMPVYKYKNINLYYILKYKIEI